MTTQNSIRCLRGIVIVLLSGSFFKVSLYLGSPKDKNEETRLDSEEGETI